MELVLYCKTVGHQESVNELYDQNFVIRIKIKIDDK